MASTGRYHLYHQKPPNRSAYSLRALSYTSPTELFLLTHAYSYSPTPCTIPLLTRKASAPCILHVFVMASSGPYLKGDDDYTSETASLYSLSNQTATNTKLCPEMGDLESQRGAAFDAQKTIALTVWVWLSAIAIGVNSVALVCHLPLLTLLEAK